MVRLLLSVDDGPLFLARSPLPLYACHERGWILKFKFLYHDAGRSIMIDVETSATVRQRRYPHIKDSQYLSQLHDRVCFGG
jgi:hypothetical protein